MGRASLFCDDIWFFCLFIFSPWLLPLKSQDGPEKDKPKFLLTPRGVLPHRAGCVSLSSRSVSNHAYAVLKERVLRVYRFQNTSRILKRPQRESESHYFLCPTHLLPWCPVNSVAHPLIEVGEDAMGTPISGSQKSLWGFQLLLEVRGAWLGDWAPLHEI